MYPSVTVLVSRKHVLSPKIIVNAQYTIYILHYTRPNRQQSPKPPDINYVMVDLWFISTLKLSLKRQNRRVSSGRMYSVNVSSLVYAADV